MPEAASPALVAWQRCHGYIEKLFDALDQLDEAGGVLKAASDGKWTPAALDRAAASLLAVRDLATHELMKVEARRKHYPRKGRAG